jgi:hypothetical protein
MPSTIKNTVELNDFLEFALISKPVSSFTVLSFAVFNEACGAWHSQLEPSAS